MRKLYSFALLTVLMLCVSTAKAAVAAETLTSNIEKVLEQFAGYSVYHYYNFKTMARDGGESGTFTIATEQVGGYKDAPMVAITTEGFTNIQLGIGRGTLSAPDLRWRDASYGFYEFGSGARNFRVTGLLKDMIVVIQGAQGQSYDYMATGVLNPDAATEITDSIHSIQEGNGDEVDTYRYFSILEDGPFDFSVNRGCYLLSMAIFMPAAADEHVSAPAMKMVGVDYTARNLIITPGESTVGNTVTTWYSIGSADEPLYLEDTQIIDYIIYEYQLDEYGQKVLDENEQPIVISETPVYKKKLTTEALMSGQYGQYQLGEGEILTIDASDDSNGDGLVTVKAASVSEIGTVSDITVFQISVGEIQLNAPVLTLTGINGIDRTYTVSWPNNTLCGEDWQIFVEGDDKESYVEYDLNSIGDPVTVRRNIKAVVKVEGYLDGEVELSVVDAQDIDMSRRSDLGNQQSEEHNWDFVNLTEDVINKIDAKVIDHYVVKDEEGNELRTYTVEQYENDEIPEEDAMFVEPVTYYYGWDGLDTRMAGRHWRTWIPTYETDGDGNPTETIASSVYADDATGVFNGLEVDNDHPNYSTIAIFTNQNGLFFMSRGNIVVKDVAYGEYVMVTTNAGTTVTQYMDAENPFSVSIGSSVYVYYIDVFTYEGLPEKPETDAIQGIANTTTKATTAYTLDGRVAAQNGAINQLPRGLYIMNGKKFLVK